MNTHARGMTEARFDELRRMLEERRDELAGAVKDKIRDVRADATRSGGHRPTDLNGMPEADIHEDIEFALLQMKTETLTKVNAALERLEEGTYGYCYACGEEIASQRLQALPFAARCLDCEETHELEMNRERMIEMRSKAVSLFGPPSS
jgi:DnaK suppressor protein